MSQTKSQHYNDKSATTSNMDLWLEIEHLEFLPVSDLPKIELDLKERGAVKIEEPDATINTLGLWYWEGYDAHLLLSNLHGDEVGFEEFTGSDKL